MNKNILLIVSTFLLAIVIILVFFTFQRNRLTSGMAKETSDRFFNMLSTSNLDINAREEIYPNFRLIRTWITLTNGSYSINNISRNSDGDYEVYGSLNFGTGNSYPVFLIVGKKDRRTIIKSSKGINYAYYDRVLDYGKKIGCLTGYENDLQMGQIVEDKRLRQKMELEVGYKMHSLYDKIKTTNSIRRYYGISSGEVTIINNNDINFGYSDLECRVEFYDRNGSITGTSNLFLSHVSAYSSVSSYVSSTSENSVSFKVIPVIKNTEELKNKIKEWIIENTEYGCN